MYIKILCLIFPLIASNCTGNSDIPQESLPKQGENILLEGHVTDIDETPKFVDGDGLIFLHNESYGNVTIHIPARERICKARGLYVMHNLFEGDTIRLFGQVSGVKEITVCSEEAHFLEKIN